MDSLRFSTRQEAAATPPEPDEDSLRLAEALVFASAGPVSARALTQLLPDTADADAVIAALRARYAGRGVELVDTAGGVQFRTAPELAPRLRKVIEVPRRLPRVAMETLAIIAYHQPCTRAEIEEIRGTSLSQQTLDALLEANLVAPKGRREVPGRPNLWGTTPQFLAQFGLRDIRDLPQRGDLLLEPPQPSGVSDAPPLTSGAAGPGAITGPPPSADTETSARQRMAVRFRRSDAIEYMRRNLRSAFAGGDGWTTCRAHRSPRPLGSVVPPLRPAGEREHGSRMFDFAWSEIRPYRRRRPDPDRAEGHAGGHPHASPT